MIYNSDTNFINDDGSLNIGAVSKYVTEQIDSDPTRQQIRLPIDSTSLAVLRRSIGVINNLTPEGGAMLGTNCLVNGIVDGYIRSRNYTTGTLGWTINADGSVEFSNGTFRGTITGSTIDIGGDDATSAHIDIDGNFWTGASRANKLNAPAKINNDGTATFKDVNVSGAIKTVLFEKATISTVGGNLMVLDGDVLDEDMTSLD